jgi:uncharacterized protein (DUF362 family)/NAD-dependent dihydropyrimidine dehydrogenase PreA subunit
MSTVAVISCGTYDYQAVKAAVKKGLDLLGGAGRFARTGEKILLKVNLLVGEAPEKCVTTHPAVLRAAGELFKQAGARLYYGDSPSFGSTLAAARKAGMTAPAKEAGIELADFGKGEPVSFAEGRQNRNFVIAKPVLESDGVISLPKLKTHAFQKFTGCIKNQFGCVPGILKAEFHVKLPNANDFAKMLVDLDRLVRPRLYIMDGIYSMEGNGPRGGTPKQTGVLLFSDDPVALDATVCRMLSLDPALVPTTKFGQEFGRGTFEQHNIERAGDGLPSFKTGDFSIDRSPIRPYRSRGLLKFLNPLVLPRPVIDKSKCARCGVCVQMCPVVPRAVDWTDGDRSRPPAHDYSKCIRCYCCQEVCPEKAITVKKPLLRSMLIRKH